ncbi:hypothetical protein, partial [Sinorhizobium medicae]|uniref:hypothetical protein n=1 Tax=Sinorhizobium medicae TaxID=110321 RepID=UPI001AECE097
SITINNKSAIIYHDKIGGHARESSWPRRSRPDRAIGAGRKTERIFRPFPLDLMKTAPAISDQSDEESL